MLAAWTGRTTTTAPSEYVRKLFREYSENFEAHLVGRLKYRAPRMLRLAVEKVVKPKGLFHNAMDLGCGTGLVGVEFRSLAKRLSGIDLSPQMINHAAEKSVYDTLHVGDITRQLSRIRERFDLFLAADVFIYCGDLCRIFHAVARRAIPGAYFVFSTEDCQEPNFVLRDTGRYAHSPTYIQDLAKEHGFAVVLHESVSLRKGDTRWARGRVYVLKKEAQRADR
jgi:predicted TPR repeat methyltransferase